MTEMGTARLTELEYLPCSCPVCSQNNPEKLIATPKMERQKLLARHNLHVCFSEIKRIKQSIVEGRLWEHLTMRARAHPALYSAVRQLSKYSQFLEENTPLTKSSGMFFFDSLDLSRPEVVRYKSRFTERYAPPKTARVLVLLPQTRSKPFHKSWEHNQTIKKVQQQVENKLSGNFHVCTYAAPFGVVPDELDEVYPLSQHETATPLDKETISYVAKQIADYLAKHRKHYKKVILVENTETWGKEIASACKQVCKKFSIPLLIVG
jgi:7-cyano-7-deazaguanine tRNA-ribosyltransferase